jgi:hypothetical protein
MAGPSSLNAQHQRRRFALAESTPTLSWSHVANAFIFFYQFYSLYQTKKVWRWARRIKSQYGRFKFDSNPCTWYQEQIFYQWWVFFLSDLSFVMSKWCHSLIWYHSWWRDYFKFNSHSLQQYGQFAFHFTRDKKKGQ